MRRHDQCQSTIKFSFIAHVRGPVVAQIIKFSRESPMKMEDALAEAIQELLGLHLSLNLELS
jgi:hypothetical protein